MSTSSFVLKATVLATYTVHSTLYIDLLENYSAVYNVISLNILNINSETGCQINQSRVSRMQINQQSTQSSSFIFPFILKSFECIFVYSDAFSWVIHHYTITKKTDVSRVKKLN